MDSFNSACRRSGLDWHVRTRSLKSVRRIITLAGSSSGSVGNGKTGSAVESETCALAKFCCALLFSSLEYSHTSQITAWKVG